MVMVPQVLSAGLAERLRGEIQSFTDDYWVRWHRDAHWILDEKKKLAVAGI